MGFFCESNLNGALGKPEQRTLVKTAHIGRCPEKTEMGSGEPEHGMIFPGLEPRGGGKRGVFA